ncbi:MAG: flippase [Candidatus Nitrosotenuis sp.]
MFFATELKNEFVPSSSHPPLHNVSSEFSGKAIFRNSLLNFSGQLIPLLIGLVSIPIIIQNLGIDRFGLLAISWIVLNYFVTFDLGMGRAVVKYISGLVGTDEIKNASSYVWGAAAVQGFIGTSSCLLLIISSPFFITQVLDIPHNLIEEAQTTFYVLGGAIPIISLSATFSGVLEAKQRFDLVNSIKMPTNVLNFLFPLIGSILNWTLPDILIGIVMGRLMALVMLAILAFKVLPELKKFRIYFSVIPTLLRYGGWVTISSIVGPILMYGDRLLIASLLPVSTLSFYAAPYEAATRLWIVPWSLAGVLLPAFSRLKDRTDEQKMICRIIDLSTRSMIMVLFPLVACIVFFSDEILRVWLGPEFAVQSATVLQILCIGVLINSSANIPYVLLQGRGRPDIPAKFHLVQLPLYAALVWLLTSKLDIVGTAIAWTIRTGAEAVFLFAASYRLWDFLRETVIRNFLPKILATVSFLAIITFVTEQFPKSFSFTLKLGFLVPILLVHIYHFKKMISLKSVKLTDDHS